MGSVISRQFIVGTQYPQFGRVFKRMILIAEFVQQAAQGLGEREGGRDVCKINTATMYMYI